MTSEARKCFLNVVCYIRQFDGQKPLVHKPIDGIVTRKNVYHRARLAQLMHDPDGLRKAYPVYATYDAKRYQALQERSREATRKFFPAEANDRGNLDPGAYLEWVEANDRWLVPGAYDEKEGVRAITVDEDMKALGMSNRDVKSLDACVALLSKGEGAERALRVLKRYTGQDFANAAQWRAWLDAHRDRLVFSEVGGYRFYVAVSATEARAKETQELPLSPAGPPRELFEPVKVSASVAPAQASAGQMATVSLRMEIAPEWHVATREGKAGSEVPLYLNLVLPAGLEPDQGWILPKPIFDAEGHGFFEGTVELSHRFRVTAAAKGKLKITTSAYYQACDPSSCRPAKRDVVDTAFEVATP